MYNNAFDDFDMSNLTISTCTVITNMNEKVNLNYMSRYINIYEQNAPELDLKEGGIYNLEFYGNCARGETLVDKIKDEFNNQVTIKFKYWGFRMVNIKIFANGKLQMTGLKYENEAKEVGNLLINIINNIKITILSNIKDLKNVSRTFDYQVVYDKELKRVFYYRRYYDKFLDNFNLDINKLYDVNSNDNDDDDIQPPNHLKKYKFSIKRKNYIEGVHDMYLDNNVKVCENWYSDNEILCIIDKLEMIKNVYINDMEEVLVNSTTLLKLRENILKLMTKYNEFRFNEIDNILSNITKNIYANDDNKLVDIKTEINNIVKKYRYILEKKINRLVTVRNVDVLICNNLDKYLDNIKKERPIIIEQDLINIPLQKIETYTKNIKIPYNYHISNIETVLINSDLSVNMNINLKKFSKILTKLGISNTYEPDEHSGVNIKFYYNKQGIDQGFCKCTPHCATKEKNTVCTKITILVFRPGSIIITGSRNLEQLNAAHTLLIKLLKDNIKSIKINDINDETKRIALMNNEFRKISKKTRLFYIKKNNIIMSS